MVKLKNSIIRISYNNISRYKGHIVAYNPDIADNTQQATRRITDRIVNEKKLINKGSVDKVSQALGNRSLSQ